MWEMGVHTNFGLTEIRKKAKETETGSNRPVSMIQKGRKGAKDMQCVKKPLLRRKETQRKPASWNGRGANVPSSELTAGDDSTKKKKPDGRDSVPKKTSKSTPWWRTKESRGEEILA